MVPSWPHDDKGTARRACLSHKSRTYNVHSRGLTVGGSPIRREGFPCLLTERGGARHHPPRPRRPRPSRSVESRWSLWSRRRRARRLPALPRAGHGLSPSAPSARGMLNRHNNLPSRTCRTRLPASDCPASPGLRSTPTSRRVAAVREIAMITTPPPASRHRPGLAKRPPGRGPHPPATLHAPAWRRTPLRPDWTSPAPNRPPRRLPVTGRAKFESWLQLVLRCHPVLPP